MKRILSALLIMILSVESSVLAQGVKFNSSVFCSAALQASGVEGGLQTVLDQAPNAYGENGAAMALESALGIVVGLLAHTKKSLGEGFRNDVMREMKSTEILTSTKRDTDKKARNFWVAAGSLINLSPPAADRERFGEIRWHGHTYSVKAEELLPVLLSAIRAAFSRNTVDQKTWKKLTVEQEIQAGRQFRERAVNVEFYQYKLLKAIGMLPTPASQGSSAFALKSDSEISHDDISARPGWIRGSLRGVKESWRFMKADGRNFFDQVDLSIELLDRIEAYEADGHLSDSKLEEVIRFYVEATYSDTALKKFYDDMYDEAMQPMRRMKVIGYGVTTLLAMLLLSLRFGLIDVPSPSTFSITHDQTSATQPAQHVAPPNAVDESIFNALGETNVPPSVAPSTGQ